MARVRKCDRCGKYYEPKCGVTSVIGITEFNMDNDQVDSEDYFDLCPECDESFIRWLGKTGYEDVVNYEFK